MSNVASDNRMTWPDAIRELYQDKDDLSRPPSAVVKAKPRKVQENEPSYAKLQRMKRRELIDKIVNAEEWLFPPHELVLTETDLGVLAFIVELLDLRDKGLR